MIIHHFHRVFPAPQFAIPAAQFVIPAAQFAIPADQFAIPAHQFAIPADQFAIPALSRDLLQIAPLQIAPRRCNGIGSPLRACGDEFD